MQRTRRPTTPGDLLQEHYLKPKGVSITAFAKAVGISRRHMSEVVHGKRRVDANLAVRIGKTIGTSTGLWINAQTGIDLFDAELAFKNWRPLTNVPKQASARLCHINWGGREVRPALGWTDAPALLQASPLST